MTEETIQPDSLPVSEGLTDEQVDKFFAEGGKEDIETPEPEPIEEKAEPQESNQEAAQDNAQALEEEKHARNYQAAMKEERARRQEIQRLYEEQNQRIAQMENAFQKIVQKQQQEAVPPLPSYEEDPLGHLAEKQRQAEEYLIQQNEYLRQRENIERQTQAQAQFISAYQGAAQEYAKTTPDFAEAYRFMEQSRIKEHMAAGFTEREAAARLQEEEAFIVNKAFREGVNPAERIYALAKARGYSNRPPEPSLAEKQLEQIDKGLRNSRSLSSTPGKAQTSQGLTLEKLSMMDNDEFDKNWDKFIKSSSF